LRILRSRDSIFLGGSGFILNHGVSSLSDSDPPYRDFKKSFDFADVVLSSLRQVLKLPAVTDGLIPAGKTDVVHLDSLEILKYIIVRDENTLFAIIFC
jgi:hypothetical protein